MSLGLAELFTRMVLSKTRVGKGTSSAGHNLLLGNDVFLPAGQHKISGIESLRNLGWSVNRYARIEDYYWQMVMADVSDVLSREEITFWRPSIFKECNFVCVGWIIILWANVACHLIMLMAPGSRIYTLNYLITINHVLTNWYLFQIKVGVLICFGCLWSNRLPGHHVREYCHR